MSTIVRVNIIADTSTFLATVLNEPEKTAIIAVTLGHELAAPEILPYEIGNALSAAVKRKRLSADEALHVYQCTMAIPVDLRTVAIDNALGIACVNNIYAYDAYFLECALKLRAPLLTPDRKMREVAQKLGIKILEVSS
jgi:predicted nucleic acid-binding protein